ncbi:hypothetical protein BJ912DRAFT_1062739 [Pholiota molesta]|nr:hypothetical protein BJ912DRAFT_1062739 [Pholiota molesta]
MQQVQGSSLKDTHTLSKTLRRSATSQSIDELREDWRETFEALGELAGEDFSEYADGFNDVLYETIAADKAFAAFTQGGEFYCGVEPHPSRNSSRTPDIRDSQQHLLRPKVLQDITCRYGGCGVRVRGIDAFRMHLQTIHDLDDRALIAIATLILTSLPSRPTYYQAALCVLGKVYANSLLVAFNSRMRIAAVTASTTAHEVPTVYSTARATTNEVQARHGGIVVTREDAVAFPPLYKGEDLPRHFEDDSPFHLVSKPE